VLLVQYSGKRSAADHYNWLRLGDAARMIYSQQENQQTKIKRRCKSFLYPAIVVKQPAS